MNSWLLLMLVPLGAAAIGNLFDNDDDDHDGGDDDGQFVHNRDGLVSGTAGDDTITATRDEVGATAGNDYSVGAVDWDNGSGDSYWSWDSETRYPGGETLPGLTVIDAGAGNDDISIGLSTHADAGAGNDTISIETPYSIPHPENPETELTSYVASAVGGAGDDAITAIGSRFFIRGDAGADTITATGSQMNIDGGGGDDSLSVSHEHNNVVTGYSEGLGMNISGGNGNDTIEANFASQPIDNGPDDGISFFAWASGGDGDDTLIVSGSGAGVRGHDGNDSLTVSGEQMDVDSGEGADTLNIAGLSDSIVHLEAEDVLQGYADASDIDLRLVGVTQFQGTEGDDSISSETSINLSGGAGDDVLAIDFLNRNEIVRASTLDGGAGNDLLLGGNFIDESSPGWMGRTTWAEGDSNDLLLGGDGNDEIRFDQADTVTGGAGSDELIYLADTGSAAVVTDFTAGEDVMTIYLKPEDVSLAPGSLENPGEITITEADGKTTINLSGSDIVTLDGTGLNIGYCHSATGEPEVWTDQNGNEVDPDTLDVRIDAFETVYA